MIERSAEALLHWSSWRRWHQAWAGYYHYRRRGKLEQLRSDEQIEVAATDRTDVVWQRLEPLLLDAYRVGRRYDHSRRLVLEAIVQVMETDRGWRALPSRFPAWQTVYAQLAQWRKNGIWDKIWSELEQPRPTNQLQL